MQQEKKYVSLFNLVIANQDEQIPRYFPEDVISKFASLVSEAEDIWSSSLSFVYRAEEITGFPFHLNEKPRLYALDGIVVADALGIPPAMRASPIQAFCLYYLSVHLIDDFIEDISKFTSAFTYSGADKHIPTSIDVNASIVGFILHVNMAITSILQGASGIFSPDTIIKLQELVARSLASQTKYFLLEKDLSLTPKDVLEIKQRRVSGEATSLIADFLQVEKILGHSGSVHIKEALRSLGSLTQFTDDVRDYEEDKTNGNSNLLLSMEKSYNRCAVQKLVEWYIEEENKMIKMLQSCELSINEEQFLTIPWYPFFLKPADEW